MIKENGLLHLKLRNINLHNVIHSLMSQNPREWMFIVQISLLIITFLFLISQNLSLLQTIQEVNQHFRIAPCVNMWSVTFLFLFLCHLLNVGACVRHIAQEGHGVDHTRIGVRRTNSNYLHISFVLFHNVTCYTKFIVSRIHVNTTKLHDITCTLVAMSVILREFRMYLEMNWLSLENHHLRFKTSGELPVILEEFREYTSNK
jgi:hypothetical protein